MTIQWIAIILFALLFMGVAIYGRLKTTSAASFAIGSGANPILVGMSLATTLTSAATFIVNPGLVYYYGLSAFLAFSFAANTGIVLGLFILVKGFRSQGLGMGVISVPQWIEQHYGGGVVTRLFFALTSLLLIAFIVLIYVGLAHILVQLLGITHQQALISLILFITLYNQVGGANSHVITNMLQGIVMVIVATVLLVSGLHLLGSGNIFQQIGDISPLLIQATNAKSIMFRDYFEVIFVNVVIGFAIVCQPHVLSKGLFLKNDKEVNRMLISAMVIGTIFASVMLVGFYGLLTLGPGLKPDLVVPTYIMKNFGTTFQIIASLGILCAGISTLEAILLSLTVTFSFDIIAPIGVKLRALTMSNDREIKRVLLWGKILTVLT
ncbi:MAG: sodium:solute symporter [Bdellovibrionales bacterium]|nr:sodium:solute symporter [Bdellovibrionales bacterium]